MFELLKKILPTQSELTTLIDPAYHSYIGRAALSSYPTLIRDIIAIIKENTYLLGITFLIALPEIQFLFIEQTVDRQLLHLFYTFIFILIAVIYIQIESYNYTLRKKGQADKCQEPTLSLILKTTIRLIALLITIWIATILTLFAFIIPAIVFSVKCTYSYHAMAIEQTGIKDSLSQSWRTISGNTLFLFITSIPLAILVPLLLSPTILAEQPYRTLSTLIIYPTLILTTQIYLTLHYAHAKSDTRYSLHDKSF